jgi:hypothetical protein
MDIVEKEARIFARYLIHREATAQSINLYRTAIKLSKPSSSDKKLLKIMVAYPATIGFIDAGLVFINPTSEARRRLYFMFAILEASPDYVDLFLPKKRGPLYFLVVCAIGFRAVVKAGVGFLLVKVLA